MVNSEDLKHKPKAYVVLKNFHRYGKNYIRANGYTNSVYTLEEATKVAKHLNELRYNEKGKPTNMTDEEINSLFGYYEVFECKGLNIF